MDNYNFLYDQKTKDFLANRKNLMINGYIVFTITLVSDVLPELIKFDKVDPELTTESVYYFKLYIAMTIVLKVIGNVFLALAIYYNKDYNQSSFYVCLAFCIDTFVKPLMIIIPMRDIIVFTEWKSGIYESITFWYIIEGIIDNFNCLLMFQASIIQSSILYEKFGSKIYEFYIFIANLVYIPTIIIVFSILFTITKGLSFLIFMITYIIYLVTIDKNLHKNIAISIKLILAASFYGVIGYSGSFFWSFMINFILHLTYMSIFLRDILIRISSQYDNKLEQLTEEWHLKNSIV